MTITPTDVPLPAGSHLLCEDDRWESTPEGVYRGIESDARIVVNVRQGPKTVALTVTATATQLSDGSIDTGGTLSDVPFVFVDILADGFARECLTIELESARQLARAILATGDEVDGWIAK